ncbi:zinc finger and BTB domain-containing protein 14-like isoform X9 [Neocloeon triangulifer]|uniref:zinc finger and BTB domain-containing protein 14-like isoform X9 n=1 Tax=Neocloeon triangulifer TaxID=2078957 RepID=UPI00286F452E|nr:zinc finger and BTB domain-containing protein 14-like isoform X9 [Neocloeon triangulifer]
MASHQYSLRWNNYVKHVSTAFEALRCDRDLVDVTLSCEGKKIPAHKMLLSACSSYFKSLFKENPCQHPVIIFRNVAFDDLMALVDFMYKGEVNVEQEQLASFLNTAELLEVQGLTNSGKDVEKSKTTVEEEKTVKNDDVQPEIAGVSLPYTAPFNESSQPSPSTSSTTTLRKRRRTSPARTEDESQPKIQAVDEPVIADIEHVPLKTEPEFEHIELQPDDSVDDEDLAASGIGLESSDMDNFVMAGPSNDSLGEDKGGPANWWQAGGRGRAAEKLIEEKNGRFECGLCEKSYSTRMGCLAHYEIHLGNTVCEFCHKVLADRNALSKHRTQHLGLIRCELCRKTFATKYDLRRHRKYSKTCAAAFAAQNQPGA